MAAKMPVAPTRIRLPDPTNIDVSKRDDLALYLRTLNTALAMAFAQRPATTSPSGQLLLLSPNGSSYRVTVTDTGTIATEILHDNAPPP